MSASIYNAQNSFTSVNASLNSFGRLTTDSSNLLAKVGSLSGFTGAVGDNLFGLGTAFGQLQEGSFRGVQFAVISSSVRRGRRVVVHEYPFKDDVWVEDLGKAVREAHFRGFLIGDDVYSQRDSLVAAVETKDMGILVHPSLGSVQATLTEASFGESFERGRVVEVELTFIQSGSNKPVYPSILLDTPQGQEIAAALLQLKAGTDFARNALSQVKTGLSIVQAGVGAISSFTGNVAAIVNDALSVSHAVIGLPGNYGRYDNGSSSAPAAPATATVASMLAAAVPVRSAARAASADAITAAGNVNYGAFSPTSPVFASSVSRMTEAVRATAIDPADQIRLLVGWYRTIAPPDPNLPVPTPSPDATTQSLVAVTQIVNDLCRRSVLASLGVACSLYNPSTYDDAVTIRELATDLFDQEIQYSADYGDADTFNALKNSRTALVQDLINRGSKLPKLIQVSVPVNLPVFYLSYLIHQDATEASAMIAQVDPIHPSFMPTKFLAWKP